MTYRGKKDDEQALKQPYNQNEAITAQMVSIVSARLGSIQTTARNRMHGLECDLRVDMDYCTKLVPPFVDILENRGATAAKSRVISATTLASNQAMLERLFGSDEIAQTQVLQKKKMDLYKSEYRRNARSLVEKQLQAGIESYITRTVESFTYGINDDKDEGSTTSNRGIINLNTYLLLTYTYERIHINFWRSSFKRFLLSEVSVALFEDVFWLVFCQFYQKDSWAQQRALADAISAKHVKMITAMPRKTMDILLCIYPYAIASSICSGFYYFFPGSRHLYTLNFKNGVFLFVCQLLLGLKINLASVQSMRRHYFPEEIIDDLGTRTRPMAKLAASASTGAIFIKTALGARTSRYGEGDEDLNLQQLLSPQASKYLVGSATESSLVIEAAPLDLEVAKSQEEWVHHTNFDMDESGTSHHVRRHQQRTLFNTTQLSPLMKQYFRSPTKHVTKANFVHRTTPSADCVVGGEDTFQMSYQRKLQKGYAAEAWRQHKIHIKEIQKEQKDTAREIALLHETRGSVLSSGKKGLQAYCTALMSRQRKLPSKHTVLQLDN